MASKILQKERNSVRGCVKRKESAERVRNRAEKNRTEQNRAEQHFTWEESERKEGRPGGEQRDGRDQSGDAPPEVLEDQSGTKR